MITAKIPAAIAAATGLSESWVRRVLRRLREEGAIPSGRSPELNSRHAALVILGLTAPPTRAVPAHALALAALPNRFVPTDGGRTATDALATLVDDLVEMRVRTNGAVIVNNSWRAVDLRWIDDNGLPVTREFGEGDHAVNRLMAATTTLPLVAVRSIAVALTGR